MTLNLSTFFHLFRVRQYVKNGLVLVPLIFSQSDWGTLLINAPSALLAAVAFCLMSSAVYILNDRTDVEQDRSDPLRKSRPIASGLVSKSLALKLAVTLCALSLLCGLFLDLRVLIVLTAYLANNFAYSHYFKKRQLFDIFSIAAGFLMRIYAGAFAIGVPISAYLFLTVMFLSLYLAAGKRRYSILRLTDRRTGSSQSTQGYSVYYLDQIMLIASTVTLVLYSLYTIESAKNLFVYTIPVVTFGLFRYYYLTHAQHLGEPSEDMLQDRMILGSSFIYLLIILCDLLL